MIRFVRATLMTFLLGYGAISAQAQTPCNEVAGMEMPHFGNTVAVDIPIGKDHGYVQSVSTASARYLRARIRVDNGAARDWTLLVRDGNWRIVQTVHPADIEPRQSFWSARVYGSKIFVTLGVPSGSATTLRIDKYLIVPTGLKAPFYSSQDPAQPRWVPLNDVAVDSPSAKIKKEIRSLGDNVGLFNAVVRNESWSCTGVMIAPGLFLTNWHCGEKKGSNDEAYWNFLLLSDMFVDISWDGDNVSHELQCTEVVAIDRDRDYAIVRVRPLHDGELPSFALLETAPVKRNDPLLIIHHPGGIEKQVTTQCLVVDPARSDWKNSGIISDFLHVCDTAPGSSGAPVYNATTKKLVGLHHYGFDYDANCNPMTRTNRAVHISIILDDLKARYRPVYDEIMRAQSH
jgi:hypothetical protein